MKALVLYGDYDMRYEYFETPRIKDGCVKVKVCACGVCGSDIPRITAGGAHFYPIVLGHEFSGHVTEVGDGVTSLKVGDHVAGVPLVPCMECRDCQLGNYSQCKHYTFIGSRVQGAFADYIVVPEKNAVKIDDSVSYEQGALFEPSTVSLHALRLSGFTGGGRVAILGGGTMGVFMLQWAKIFGAKEVVVFGRGKERLEISKRLGADAVISAMDEGYLKQAMDLTGGIGYDYVFETAGSVDTMRLAFELAANKASICMVGTPTEDLTFTPRQWELMNRKEFRLTGSWMSGSAPFPGDEWTLTAHYFANGQLKYDPEIFSHKIPMSWPEKLVDALKQKEYRKGRILLVNKEEK